MIETSIIELNNGRKGSSRYAIKKYIWGNYRVNCDNTSIKQINLSLKREVDKGNLVKVKGSFKVAPKSTYSNKSFKKQGTYPYADMIGKAIIHLNDGRKGSSRYAIKKYIQANYRVNFDTFITQIRLSLNREIDKGNLVKVKGSFKVTPKFKKYITGR